jgi:hypothetical protein
LANDRLSSAIIISSFTAILSSLVLLSRNTRIVFAELKSLELENLLVEEQPNIMKVVNSKISIELILGEKLM